MRNEIKTADEVVDHGVIYFGNDILTKFSKVYELDLTPEKASKLEMRFDELSKTPRRDEECYINEATKKLSGGKYFLIEFNDGLLKLVPGLFTFYQPFADQNPSSVTEIINLETVDDWFKCVDRYMFLLAFALPGNNILLTQSKTKKAMIWYLSEKTIKYIKKK